MFWRHLSIRCNRRRTHQSSRISREHFSPPRTAGFSLIDLLLSITIVGLLLSLIVPAVQSARASARRIDCESRLRQIGTALQGFETAHRKYPNAFCGRVHWPNQAYTTWCVSPLGQLAPHFGSMVEWKAISRANVPPSWDVSSLNLKSPPVLCCPEDSLAAGKCSNYRFNRGLLPVYPGDPHGVVTGFQSRRAGEVTDGLSRTVFASERVIASESGHDPQRDPLGASGDSYLIVQACLQANAQGNETPPSFPPVWGTNWLSGEWNQSLYYHYLPPNSRVRDCGQLQGVGSALITARSGHVGGVHVLFGDAHCEFVSNEIDLAVWRQLGSRDGWEATVIE